jgi:MFS family permease
MASALLVTDPAWVLVLQLLHGLSFGAFLIGGVSYMHERTPQGLATTSQALFTSVAFGLASVTGSLIGGASYDRIGFAALFQLLSVIAAGGLVLFFFTSRTYRNKELVTG